MALGDYFIPLTLQRKTESDPLGVGDSFTDVATIEGYIQRNGGGEAVVKNEYGEQSTLTLYTEYTSDILFGDRIVKNGVNYSVVSPEEPDGVVSLGKHREIGLVYVK